MSMLSAVSAAVSQLQLLERPNGGGGSPGPNLNYPRVLPDGRLLVERTLVERLLAEHTGDDQRETWLLDLATQTSSQVSDTPAPIDLVDGKLYYISEDRALRVRLLDSGREATLVNGAVFATPMPAR